MAITGQIKAIWSERLSAMYPMSVGEGTSPRIWIMKMFTARAVARMWAPTELIRAAFKGAVFNSSRNAAIAMPGSIVRPLVNRATIITGTPSAMLTAETE